MIDNLLKKQTKPEVKIKLKEMRWKYISKHTQMLVQHLREEISHPAG